MEKSIQEAVKTILREHMYLDEVENERFRYDIHADYSDALSENQKKIISQSDDKRATFYDSFSEVASDAIQSAEQNEILNIIEHHWDEETYGPYDEHEDEVEDYTREIIDIDFPYDHFLNEEVLVNIMVNTGDGNQDFVLNNLASYNTMDEEEIDEESSMLWLTREQGYTKAQLEKTIEDGESDNAFLSSVLNECQNVTTHMNALTFFVRMTLRDFITLADSEDDLILSKDTACGLYDPWQGAGSVLGINLERDVVLPARYREPHIDGARGYGIDSIYGMMQRFWGDTMTPKFLEESEAK